MSEQLVYFGHLLFSDVAKRVLGQQSLQRCTSRYILSLARVSASYVQERTRSHTDFACRHNSTLSLRQVPDNLLKFLVPTEYYSPCLQNLSSQIGVSENHHFHSTLEQHTT